MSYQGIETSHFKLVQFLLLYHVISNVHICSFTCIIFHVHGGASKMVLHAQNLVHKKKKIMKASAHSLEIMQKRKSFCQSTSVLHIT